MSRVKLYRWRKRILLPLAAMPLLQATGTCDQNALLSTFGSQIVLGGFNVLVGSFQQTLLQLFPSADVLQTLFGANRTPFFS